MNLDPKRLIWVTDIHLNFLNITRRISFYEKIIKERPDYVLITGDIAESHDFPILLREMHEVVNKPIYFVLGNHDYYGSSINNVHNLAKSFSVERLSGPIHLPGNATHITANAMLIGIDNWYDTMAGKYGNVQLPDFHLIEEFYTAGTKRKLRNRIKTYAKLANEHLIKQLTEVLYCYNLSKIIIAMHVPPFKELSLHKGVMANDDFMPYFSSVSTGEVLLDFANKWPETKFEVRCGHTHHYAEYLPLPNLHCVCGYSEYYRPMINGVIEI